jgi:Domain of unknown function (DUF4276)
MKRILPIVEGDGDFLAVPELVRRVAHKLGQFDLTVCKPHKRGDLPKVLGRFDAFFETALIEGCPILWVMDYDCDTCHDQAAEVKRLRSRASELARGMAFEFVFFVQEFETLFLADVETTRKVFADIGPTTTFPTNPEAVRDAKGWLSAARPRGFAYKPTQHQQKLAAQVDLGRLRLRSPSFARFEDAVASLLAFQQ